MQAVCTTCQTVSDVRSLIPQNCSIYEITKEGVVAITSLNIGFSIYTEFYDNFLEFDRFVNRIRLLAEQKFSGIREKVKEVRTTQNVVNKYYKNMMNRNYVDPQFWDKKK